MLRNYSDGRCMRSITKECVEEWNDVPIEMLENSFVIQWIRQKDFPFRIYPLEGLSNKVAGIMLGA